MLSKETMDKILAEEKFRQELRNTINPQAAKPKHKVIEFLNSTFFLALLSSLLIPFIVSNFQAQSQKAKEKEVLQKKIANERAEILNRVDIIIKIDTTGIPGTDYPEIRNAFRGFDSTGGFSVSEEFTKRNIFSLIADYKYDLQRTEKQEENDSIIARLTDLTNALQEAHTYLNALLPFMFTDSTFFHTVRINKGEGTRNPTKVDIFYSGYPSLNVDYSTRILPRLRSFQ